jgi:hypothetical protein
MKKEVLFPHEIGFSSYYEWYQSLQGTSKLNDPNGTFSGIYNEEYYWACCNTVIKGTIKELVAEIQMLKSAAVNNFVIDLEETIKQLKGR